MHYVTITDHVKSLRPLFNDTRPALIAPTCCWMHRHIWHLCLSLAQKERN